MRFIWACTTETLRKRLVEALVQPHLDYCTVVCLDVSFKLRERLQRLSNSCVRYIFAVRRNEQISPLQPELEHPHINTETGDKTFRVQGVHLWNSLPSSLRQLLSYYSFRRAVRQHLLDLDLYGFRELSAQGLLVAKDRFSVKLLNLILY